MDYINNSLVEHYRKSLRKSQSVLMPAIALVVALASLSVLDLERLYYSDCRI